MTEPLDMIIIGAGLSGIGAACRYVTAFPKGRYTVLEARDAIGGTWDLFRYPGIRSDSDMLTLGYDFRPWPGVKTLASGPAIRDYVRETAAEYGVDQNIEFGSRVIGTNFSTDTDLWTIDVEDVKSGDVRQIVTRFILSCAGYYRYDKPYDPEFAGREDFRGEIIHPQFWPDDFDHTGKRIAIIGSGATAVTLVPELAKTAQHVVQVQRTPSYVASMPSEDPIMKVTSKIMPESWSFAFNRWKNRMLAGSVYRRAKANPERARRNIRKRAVKALGKDYPVDVHFNPPYDPWDQRLCIVPDGDLFDAVKEGRASIVTGHIERFDVNGIIMKDGTRVDADVIVTATGLSVNVGTNYAVRIDGQAQDYSQKFTYRGVMTTDIPNRVDVYGYTNASWTLRADLTSRWCVRVLEHMKATGMTRVTPVPPSDGTRFPASDFQAGYFQRVMHLMPSQGCDLPWRNIQNYKHDCETLLKGPIGDEGLTFSRLEQSALEAAE
ncbi:MAG: NAD(P)/FAD-dependent oxidoreductase [Pseudomonadota bacterium]